MKKLYVGNLPYQTTDKDLHELFASKGQVASAQVVIDRETGRSRGFGFVEMPNDGEAQAAIEAFNGADYGGRPLVVNEARPKTEGGGRGGFGGGRGRGGYGGGGTGGRGGW
jgi:RNA recognition motif-containing protein